MLQGDRLTLVVLTLIWLSPVHRYLHVGVVSGYVVTEMMAGQRIRCSSDMTTPCCMSFTTQLEAASASAARLADAAGSFLAERQEGLQLDLQHEQLLNIFFVGGLVTSIDAVKVVRQLGSCVRSAICWVEGEANLAAVSRNTSESARLTMDGWVAVTPAYTVLRPTSPLGWLRRSLPAVHVASSFFTLDETTQALTLLHECGHVIGFGVDQAYLHERARFASLRAEQALSNPDSVALLVLVAASLRGASLGGEEGDSDGVAWLFQRMLRDGSERDGVLRALADWVRFSTRQKRDGNGDC